jgi:hypothetical protein
MNGGWGVGGWEWRTHFRFVELELPPSAATRLLLKLAKALLAPALTDADQDGKDQLHYPPSSHSCGMTFVLRCSSSKARSAQLEVRT